MACSFSVHIMYIFCTAAKRSGKHESYPNQKASFAHIRLPYNMMLQIPKSSTMFFKKLEFCNAQSSCLHQTSQTPPCGFEWHDTSGWVSNILKQGSAHHYQKGVQPRTPMAISLVLWRPEIELSLIFMTGSWTRPNV